MKSLPENNLSSLKSILLPSQRPRPPSRWGRAEITENNNTNEKKLNSVLITRCRVCTFSYHLKILKKFNFNFASKNFCRSHFHHIKNFVAKMEKLSKPNSTFYYTLPALHARANIQIRIAIVASSYGGVASLGFSSFF